MKNKNLGKSLNRFYADKSDVQELLYGELGIPINGVKKVDVPGRAGYVYVRLRGNKSELIEAYNASVPSKYDYPVIVSRKGNTYTIAGKDQGKYSNMGNSGNATTTVGITPMPNHGGQHSFNPSLGMGADPTWVYGQQFMPNVAYPSGSSMMLTINPTFYEWNGQWKYSQSTGTPSFSPYVPTITGSARMALLFVDGQTGDLQIAGGVGFSGGINNAYELAQYIPDVDRNKSIPIAAVKLTTGTTALDYSMIYDMRDYFTVSKYFNGIGIQDGGVAQGTGTILNFGNNLAVSMAGGVVTIDGQAGGGGGGIGFVAWDEGVFLATGTVLNFTGGNVVATVSGTVVNVFVTGSSSSVSPPVTGSIVIWDEGVLKGSALTLDVVSAVADVSISGTVARLFITGSASSSTLVQDEGVLLGSPTVFNFVGAGVTATLSGTVANINIPGGGSGTATYFRAAQPTPLLSTTGTYWKLNEPYATGSLAVFNQGHALIIGVDYSSQYPQSGTYQYTEAQPTGTYHLALYGVPVESGGGASIWTQNVNEVGSSFANFTALLGTWASDGTQIKQTNTTGNQKNRANYTAIIRNALTVIEMEVYAVTSGNDYRVGFVINAGSDNGGLGCWIDTGRDQVVLEAETVAVRTNFSVTINTGTWYKLRCLIAGPTIEVFLDGTYRGTATMIPSAYGASNLTLYTQNTEGWFKNIKTWNINLPA